MIFYVYKEKEIGATLDISTIGISVNVKSADLHNKSILPHIFSHAKTNEEICDLFSVWLGARCVQSGRYNFEPWLMKKLNIRRYNTGRMNGMQTTLSLLSAFQEGYDDYTVIPKKSELLYFGYIDPEWINLYAASPIFPSLTQRMYNVQNTIPSASESEWKIGSILVQKCRTEEEKIRAREICNIENEIYGSTIHDIYKNKEDTFLKTDFSGFHEVERLSTYADAALVLSREAMDLIEADYGKEAVKLLSADIKKTKEKNIVIGMPEVFITIGENKNIRIVNIL